MALTKITTSVVAVNSLTTANIADNSIDATKIASNSILTRHIDDAQITTDQILDGTIATADIADDAVTEDKLANAINTSIAAKLPLAGGTMTGNITLGDNNKAIFGAGSDLQIYHDGSNSYIVDGNSGSDLLIRSNNIVLENTSGHNMIHMASGGAVQLYHNNVSKVKTTATGAQIGLNDSTITRLQLYGATNAEHQIKFGNDGTNGEKDGAIRYFGEAHGTTANRRAMTFSTAQTERMRIDSSGNLIMTAGGTIRAGGANDLILDAGESGTPDIYLQSGGSTKVKIEGSNGNVGIGETNPDAPLHITSNTPIISFDESDASQEYRIGSFGGAFALYDSTDSAYRLIVDGSGKVGIGTTTPQKTFHIEHAAGASEGILISGASDTTGHTAGILLRAEGGEADSTFRAKGAIFFERTGTYGVGKLHLANDIGADNNSATISDARMTLDTDGTISTSGDFKPGADVIMNNGRGISFAATSNSSGSMSSELLDDYEEGTWTPTINSGTISNTATGTYTKVGRLVTVTYYILLTTMGGSTTGVHVGGLPFTSGISGNTGSHSAGSILCRYFTKNQIVSYVPAGVTYIAFYNNSSSNWDQITFGELEATHDNDFEAHGTLQYVV